MVIKLNKPTFLFGSNDAPYAIIIQDNVPLSDFGNGGKYMIFGYTYSTGLHGAQMLFKYGNILKYRTNTGTGWTAWKNITLT